MRTSSLTIFGALLFFHTFLFAQTSPAAIDSSPDSTLSYAPGIKLDLNVYPSTESSGVNLPAKSLQPLYLIDGKPVIKKGQIPSDNYPQNTSILQVSPSEIISIKYIQPEIAKARFGSRADQGAIMIKTRMGTRRFQPVFSFSSYSGVQWVARRPQMLGAQDYIMLANEAYQNSGQQSPYTYSALTPDTDWQKEIFRPGYIQNYHLSLNGRKKRSSYLLSANYLHNQNPFIHASQEQISAKFSGKWTLNNNLTAGGQGSLSLGKLKGLFFPLDSGVNESLISQALFYPPNISVNSNDLSSSELNGLRNGITNPLVIDDHRKETFQRRLSMAQAWLNGHFGAFSFEGKWAVDNTFDQKNQFVSAALLQGPNLKNLFSSNLWSFSQHYQFNYQFDHFLHYHSELNLITKLEHQYQNWGFERLKGNGVNGPDADISTADILSSYEAANQWHQYAGILRAEYNFRRQYTASANLRLQHSPQFATQKRSILLPSFSLVWNIDDEDFFRRHIGYFFDVVQLGTSFGMSGNEQARIFPQLSNILWNHPGSFQSDLLSHAWLANRSGSLGWEKTQEWDLNMRVRFWQGRIEFSAVRYIKSTRDILTLTSHPDQGYQWQNLGMVTNKGWELETRIRGINLNRVGIYGGANITFNNNRLDDLGNLDQKTTPGFLGSGPLSEPIMVLEPGKPIGNFYGYQTNGLYQTGDNFDTEPEKSPGDIRIIDLNQDGIINEEDKTIIGNAISKFFYGFNLNFSRKRLTASLNFSGKYGNDILNYNLIYGRDAIDGSNNLFAETVERWTPETPHTDIPRPTLNPETRITDRLIEDGSHLRLADASVTYSFQSVILGKTSIKNVKVYVKGQNLLLFTKYSGYDPEVLSFGSLPFTTLPIDRGAYPRARSVILGVDFTL